MESPYFKPATCGGSGATNTSSRFSEVFKTTDNSKRRHLPTMMEVEKLFQSANTFQARFKITCDDEVPTIRSTEYMINRVAQFQVKIIVSYNRNDREYHNFVFIKLRNVKPNNEYNYSVRLSSNILSVSGATFSTDDGSLRFIGKLKAGSYLLDINFQMEVNCQVHTFANLYDDDELTDFNIQGENCFVPVHKAVLAAASPVMKRMLCGQWKETSDGHIKIAGVVQQTLDNFKEYIYCNKLPEKGLDHLLKLASFFMMPVLERKCIDRFLQGLTADNLTELLEFAMKNNVAELMLLIFECIQTKSIKLEDIRECVLRDMLFTKSDEV